MKKLTVFSLCMAVSLVFTGCGGTSQSTTKESSAHGSHDHNGAQGKTTMQVQTGWKFANDPVLAKQDQKLQITIKDKSGNPINDFEEEYTKLMHLIVVSKDLSFFDHIHPQYLGKGVFEITPKLPAGGDYEFIADFVPKGSTPTYQTYWTHVEGDAAAPQPIQPDNTLTKVVDGKEVTLSFNGDLKAKTPLELKFHITDAATKQPITTLEPYLGVVGHTVILDDKANNYVHVHPINDKSSGPDAIFGTELPGSGVFKIWGQFQHQGKVFTVPFVVQVK